MRDYRRYSIGWRRLANPTLWTRAKGRLRGLLFGREPYLRPPSWSNEHAPQTLRKILSYESQVMDQIARDRMSVKSLVIGAIAGFTLVVTWHVSAAMWSALFGWS